MISQKFARNVLYQKKMYNTKKKVKKVEKKKVEKIEKIINISKNREIILNRKTKKKDRKYQTPFDVTASNFPGGTSPMSSFLAILSHPSHLTLL